MRFGLVCSCWTVGGVNAAVSLPRLLRYTTPVGVVLAAVPFSAVLGVAAAAVGSWRLGGLCLLGWSVAWTLVAISAVSYRQQVAPEHLTGRVSTAGRMLAWGVGWTGGALTSGLVGQLVGVRTAMITLTALGSAGAALAWLPPLRAAHHCRAGPQRRIPSAAWTRHSPEATEPSRGAGAITCFWFGEATKCPPVRTVLL